MIRNKIFKFGLPAVAVVSALTGAYFMRLYWQEKYTTLLADLAKAEAANMQHLLIQERLQRDKADAIGAMLEAQESAQKTKEKVITKEVIKYVTKNVNSGCNLDDEWVRISDAAVPVPRFAEAASSASESAAKIRDLGEALRVITNNYAACQDSVNRLQGWQQWYRSIQQSN